MRRAAVYVIFLWLILLQPAHAASGRIVKVLPQFLDNKGRYSDEPSLYQRDAYQAYLREHPEKRSAMRFAIQWKLKGAYYEPLKVRLELKGAPDQNASKVQILESPVQPNGFFSNWSDLRLEGAAYRDFGAVTAWRATLWEGTQLLAEQKSFLW
jgi:hypothetical protein